MGMPCIPLTTLRILGSALMLKLAFVRVFLGENGKPFARMINVHMGLIMP